MHTHTHTHMRTHEQANKSSTSTGPPACHHTASNVLHTHPTHSPETKFWSHTSPRFNLTRIICFLSHYNYAIALFAPLQHHQPITIPLPQVASSTRRPMATKRSSSTLRSRNPPSLCWRHWPMADTVCQSARLNQSPPPSSPPPSSPSIHLFWLRRLLSLAMILNSPWNLTDKAFDLALSLSLTLEFPLVLTFAVDLIVSLSHTYVDLIVSLSHTHARYVHRCTQLSMHTMWTAGNTCLVPNSVTANGFTGRMIHYNGAWDTGKVRAFARVPDCPASHILALIVELTPKPSSYHLLLVWFLLPLGHPFADHVGGNWQSWWGGTSCTRVCIPLTPRTEFPPLTLLYVHF